MKINIKLFGLLMMLSVFAFTSCSDDDDNAAPKFNLTNGGQILSSVTWETTEVIDQNGVSVDLDVPSANMFVGLADYNTDGTFKNARTVGIVKQR